MEENQEIDTKEKSRKRSSLPLFIFLFLASLVLNLFLFFKYAKNGVKIQEQNKELTMLYKAANFRADSLQKELDFAVEQLQDKINENLAQSDLKEELRENYESQLQNLRSEHRRLSGIIAAGGSSGSGTSNPSKTLLLAKTEIDNLKASNSEYIAKAEEIQQQYALAKEEAETNASTAKTYRIENDSLIEITTTLNKKLSTASILRIAGLSVSPIREKKGKQEITEKASKTERLKINFSVLSSELTEKEDKELIIRIIEPNGAVLTKNTESLT
ncbi:MAG: hypothetical protein KJP21_08325, partial [Bacteroidia bacterium]|nr:hypothetical protein [Bacteroidia bacterium]